MVKRFMIILLVMGCQAAHAPPKAETRAAESTSRATAEPTPAEVRVSMLTTEPPGYTKPFDFWRVIASDGYNGSEQFCLAERVRSTNRGQIVECAREEYSRSREWRVSNARVRLLAAPELEGVEIAPSDRGPRVADVETLLRVEVVRYDHEPLVRVLAIHRVDRSESDPTPPRSRCCKRGHVDRPQVRPRGRFDPDALHRRQVCALGDMYAPSRSTLSDRHDFVTARGSCQNGEDDVSMSFHFSREVAEHVVRPPGLIVRGYLRHPGTFIVE